MMADMNRMETALRNAHNAGDTEAAQRIANMIREAQPQQQSFEAQASQMDPTSLSVARSKNDAFGEYLRGQAIQPREGETEDQRFKRLHGEIPQEAAPGVGEGMARAGVQGATFGAGDELVAGGAAALDSVFRGDDFGDAYDQRLSRERNRINQFRDSNPVLAYGSEIAGSIPTAIAPIGPLARVAQGGSATAKMAGGALVGATQGGAYGFNAGEGGFRNRAKSAGVGAGVGGAVGGVAPVVGGAAGRLFNRRATDKAAQGIGVSRPTYDVMQRLSQADDSLTGAGQQRIQSAGPTAMLADAGPSQRAALDLAVQRTGPASRIATERVERRVNDAAGRLTQTLDSTLGAPQGVRESARGIAQGTSAARSDAYTKAYSLPIDYASDAGRNIEATLGRVPDRIMQGAIQKANDQMRVAGVRNQQIMASIADDGAVTFTEMPNVQQLDQIKRALGEMGAEAVDKFGRPTGDGKMMGGLARDLRNAVQDAVPEYGQAVRLGGDKIQRDKALELGRDLLRPNVTREMVGEVAGDLSDEARQAAFQGLRGSIDDMLANVKRTVQDGNVDAREAVKLIKDMSSRANREKVSLLLGDDAANVLFRDIDQAAAAFDLRAGVSQNSKTYAREALGNVVDDQVSSGPVAALRDGDPVESAKTMVQALLGGGPGAKQKVTDRVLTEMAEALTGPNPNQFLQQLQAAPGQINTQALKAQNVAEFLAARNAPASERMRDALMSRQ